MGYDVMAAWEKRSFEFNDSIQERGDAYKGRIPRDSKAGGLVSQDSYAAPSFTATTSRWSPPATPTSPRQTFSFTSSPRQSSPRSSQKNSRTSSPRVDSALSDRSTSRRSLAKSLYLAAAAGDVPHMKLLVSLGAEVNSATAVPELYEAFKPAKPGALCPLAGAAWHGHIEAVEYLLDIGAQISPDIMISTSSPLQQACRADDIVMAQLLIAAGADINQPNYYKSTPLMYAVKYGSPELVHMLLSHHPDFSAHSFMGSSATHWAIWPGRLNMLELLLQAGADPDDSLTDESTLLHCASLSGWVEGVKLLVRYGADPFKRDNDWKTPLDVAVLNKHDEVIEVLKAAMLLAS